MHVFSQTNNYVVVSGTIEVDPSGDTWTQAYSGMVVSAGGMVLNTSTGVAHARRLRPVPEDALTRPSIRSRPGRRHRPRQPHRSRAGRARFAPTVGDVLGGAANALASLSHRAANSLP